jgi:hypothetical protein
MSKTWSVHCLTKRAPCDPCVNKNLAQGTCRAPNGKGSLPYESSSSAEQEKNQTWTEYCGDKNAPCDPCANKNLAQGTCRAPDHKGHLVYDGSARVKTPESIKRVVLKTEPLTTLDIIKATKLWTDKESISVAEDIDDLTKIGIKRAVYKLLTNKYIHKLYQEYIEKEEETEQIKIVKRYEVLISKNFLSLLSSIQINPQILKQQIIENLQRYGVSGLYDKVYALVRTAVKSNSKNTSLVYLSNSNSERSELLEELKISSFTSIVNIFNKFGAVHKESASNSLVFYGTFNPSAPSIRNSVNSIEVKDLLKPITLYFKVYPVGNVVGKKYVHDTTGLQFEKLYYKELFKLVQYNITPNIVCTIATSKISNFDIDFLKNASLTHEFKQELTEQVKNYNISKKLPVGTTWDDTDVIITHPGGKKLEKIFHLLSPEDRKKVLFQIMYTMYVFEKIEFSHGDLHSGNIFVIELAEEIELCYMVGKQQFKFKTKYLLKIYDFDHSTLCKTTTLKLNKNTQNDTIDKYLNPIRKPSAFFNQNYAETNIFNKNLDIVIFIIYIENIKNSAGTSRYPYFSNSFTLFGGGDPDCDNFFRSIFPGFDSSNKLAQSTISKTYISELTKSSNVEEANRIFNTDSPANYNVQDKILNNTWLQYSKDIRFSESKYGRIVKDFDNPVENNHLWIPDSIIKAKLDILMNPYFTTLHSNDDIDIRNQVVYNIDNKL